MLARIPANGIPGVLVLPFWQAKFFTNNGMVDVRAIVWHFAQGGNTDVWLTHPTNDNSSSLILKLSGAVRQMVEFTDASHSLHIDRVDGPPGPGDYGIFSLDAAQKALGAGWRNPNLYIVTIEVEGFAATGPTAEQARTVPILARYLEGLFPNAVHLGHRDFQDYKPCPGPSLFRGLLPHGGRLTTGEDMADYQTITTVLPFGGKYTIPAGKAVTGIQLSATGVAATKVWAPRAAPSAASYDATVITNKTRGNPFIRATDGFFAGWLISAGQVDEVPNPAPTPPATDTTPFSQAQLDAAVAAATAAYKVSIEAERADDTAAADQLLSIAATLRLNR